MENSSGNTIDNSSTKKSTKSERKSEVKVKPPPVLTYDPNTGVWITVDESKLESDHQIPNPTPEEIKMLHSESSIQGMEEPSIDMLNQSKIGDLHSRIYTSHDDIQYLLSKKINGYLKGAFIKPFNYK